MCEMAWILNIYLLPKKYVEYIVYICTHAYYSFEYDKNYEIT